MHLLLHQSGVFHWLKSCSWQRHQYFQMGFDDSGLDSTSYLGVLSPLWHLGCTTFSKVELEASSMQVASFLHALILHYRAFHSYQHHFVYIVVLVLICQQCCLYVMGVLILSLTDCDVLNIEHYLLILSYMFRLSHTIIHSCIGSSILGLFFSMES